MEAGFQLEWLSFITSSVRAWVSVTILSFVDFVFEHDKSPCLKDVFALMQTNQSISCKKSPCEYKFAVMATLSAHCEKALNGSQEKGLLLAFVFGKFQSIAERKAWWWEWLGLC